MNDISTTRRRRSAFSVTFHRLARFCARVLVLALALGAGLRGHAQTTPIPPTFVDQPPAIYEVAEGDLFQVYARASGSGFIRYRWQRWAAGASAWVDLTNSPSVIGTTSTTFSWYQVTAAMDGDQFRSMATSSAGVAYSNVVTLQIKAGPPVIGSYLDARDVPLGGAVSFTPFVVGSTPRTYQWFKGEVEVPGQTAATLNLTNVQVSDGGTYSLSVANAYGTQKVATSRVVVVLPPTVTTPPVSQVIRVGSFVTFSAVIVAQPPNVTYQWSKDGVPVTGATSTTLHFSNVKMGDAGRYALTTTNLAGSVTTEAATLTVMPPLVPSVVGANDFSAALGGSVTLSFQSGGVGPLTYQWYRDGEPIPGATAEQMVLTNVQLADFAEYFQTITNAGGTTVSATVRLNRTEPTTRPSHHWLDAREDAGVVHFLLASPARILRYDLASETWLTPWELPETPRAFAWSADRLYVAYARSVVEHGRDFSDPTPRYASSNPILGLGIVEKWLMVVESSNSGVLAQTVDCSSGLRLWSSRLYGDPTGFFAFSESSRLLVGRPSNSGPARLQAYLVKPAGWVGEGIYMGESVHAAGRTWMFKSGAYVVEASGNVRDTQTLRLEAHFGRGLDDAIDAPGTGYYSLRHGKVTEFDEQFRALRSVELGGLAERLWLQGNSLFCFEQPASAGGLPLLRKIDRGSLSAPQHAARVDSDDPTVWSPQIEIDDEGTVYLYSKLARNVLRWSSETNSYLAPLALPNAPNFVAVAARQGRLYFDAADQQIRSLSLVDPPAVSEPYINTPAHILRMQPADEFNWVSARGTVAGGYDPHYVYDAAGRRLTTEDTRYDNPVPLAWSPVDRRVFLVQENSQTGLSAATLSAAGEIDLWESPISGAVSYFPTRPLRVSADGSRAVFGSGAVVDAVTMSRIVLLPWPIVDAAWSAGRLHTVRTTSSGCIVEVWNESDWSVSAAVALPGIAARLLTIKGDRLLLVTTEEGRPRFHHLVAGTLQGLDTTAGVPPEVVSAAGFKEISVGERAWLWVATRGGDQPDYQWQYRLPGGAWMAVEDGPGVAGARTAQLAIASFPSVWSGAVFRVIVANAAGSAIAGTQEVALTGEAGVVEVSVGNSHTVFRRADGSVWTIGGDFWAMLDGTRGVNSPLPMFHGSDAVSAGAGPSVVHWLDRDGRLRVAGSVPFGTWPTLEFAYDMPPKLLPGSYAMVSNESSHALYLSKDGIMTGSGTGSSGQLGTEWTGTDAGPKILPLAEGVSQIHAKSGTTLYVKADGSLWVMGALTGYLVPNFPPQMQGKPVLVATDVKSVEAESTFVWFLKRDGSLWGLGKNDDGQLGDGSTTARTTPVQIATGVRAFAVGTSHGIYVKESGGVWACGRNDDAQLGDGTTTRRLVPVRVADEAVALAAGVDCSLLIKADGSLWAVGNCEGGKLGRPAGNLVLRTWTFITGGLPVTPAVPTGVQASVAASSLGVRLNWTGDPAALSYEIWRSLTADVSAATQLAADWKGTFYLDGNAEPETTYYYWIRARGLKEASGLGGGVSGSRAAAVAPQIVTQPESGFVNLGAAVRLRVEATGDPAPTYHWQQRLPGAETWIDLVDSWPAARTDTADFYFTYFQPASDGTAFRCVVTNPAGQAISDPAVIRVRAEPPRISQPPVSQTVELGNRVRLFAIVEHTAVSFTYQWRRNGIAIPGATQYQMYLDFPTEAEAGDYTVELAYAGGTVLSEVATLTVLPAQPVIAVAAGGNHSLLLQRGGTVRGMGQNDFGQAGSVGWPALPTKDRPESWGAFSTGLAVAAGETHSLVMDVRGTVDGVGDNDSGQNNLHPGATTGAMAIAAGRRHSLILRVDRTVWAAGANDFGQLGNGTMQTPSTAVAVASGVKAIAAGGQHSLWIKDDGSLWAVGANNAGQLGDGSTTGRVQAVSVATGVRAIAAGESFSLFIKEDGTLWGMGSNAWGQLGAAVAVGNSADRPIQLALGVVAATAGKGHTFFITEGGALWALGLNDEGQLGIPGDTTNRAQPTKVADHVKAVAAGASHTLFVDQTGMAWAMGSNRFRQLGVPTTGAFTSTPVPILTPVATDSPLTLRADLQLKASDGTVGSGVQLEWTGVPDEVTYEIWRNSSSTYASATRIVEGVTSRAWIDVTAPTGVVSYYWVRARAASGLSPVGPSESGYRSLPSGAPWIWQEPSDASSPFGGSVSFTVSATGSGVLSYQWRKDGQPLANATRAYLDLSGLTFASAGTYDVVVSNAIGQVTSRAVTLEVSQSEREIYFPQPVPRAFSPEPFQLKVSGAPGLVVTVEVLSGPALISGHQLTLTGVGEVRLRATQGGNEGYLPAEPVERTLVVVPALVEVQLSGLFQAFDGSPKSVAAITQPAGLPVRITYDGSSSIPAVRGSYLVRAEVTDEKYRGLAFAPLVIGPARQVISFTAPVSVPFSRTPLTLHVSSSSGLPVVLSKLAGPAALQENSLAMTGIGRVRVQANQWGNELFEAAAPADISVVITLSFAFWLEQHFTVDELLDSAISGPNADPDGDGLANLLEYALGLDPRTATSAATTSGLPEAAASGSEWTYTYTRPADRSDVTYAVEISTTLASWTNEGVTHELVSTDPVAGTQTWRARVPLATGENVFFRLKVEAP